MTYSQINPAWDRMHRTSESQIVQERVVEEPFWTDHCTHGHDTYAGSFIHYERTSKGEHKSKVDIYIFPDDYYGHEICLRYGEEGSEYMSPTGLASFIGSAGRDHNGLYAKALEVLLRRGKIKWERNP